MACRKYHTIVYEGRRAIPTFLDNIKVLFKLLSEGLFYKGLHFSAQHASFCAVCQPNEILIPFFKYFFWHASSPRPLPLSPTPFKIPLPTSNRRFKIYSPCPRMVRGWGALPPPAPLLHLLRCRVAPYSVPEGTVTFKAFISRTTAKILET